jgi:hypothetical protein
MNLRVHLRGAVEGVMRKPLAVANLHILICHGHASSWILKINLSLKTKGNSEMSSIVTIKCK